VRPPFAYFGGKIALAEHIVALLPEHRTYIEPFAGSCAVLFAKEPSPIEIINDLDDALINFWTMLRERTEDLERVCALTPHSRAEYARADIDEPGIDDLERARRYWVRVNQSFGKTANVATGWSITVARTQSVPNSIRSRLGRFAAVVERLSAVSIECCDAVDLITRLGMRSDTVLYVDPPYLGTTRSLRHGNGGSYRFEFAGEAAHERLAEALHATNANVVLSGYPSPMYESLYGAWNVVDRRVLAFSSNAKTSTRVHKTERFWMNFEPAARAADPQLWEAGA
jgi:DNA adenine methylase